MYYKRLEVKPSATTAEIRASFHRLALQHHPDKAGGSTEAFQALQVAYSALSNESTRAQYDADLRQKRKAKKTRFVRPAPMPTVIHGVTFKLVDEDLYTFECAPGKLPRGIRFGDSVSFQGKVGTVTGLAGDGWVYWCEGGARYATQMCDAGSTFALSSVEVLIHAPTTRGVPSMSSVVRPTRKDPVNPANFTSTATAPEMSKSKVLPSERIRQEILRRDRIKRLNEAVKKFPSDETAAREEAFEKIWADLMDLHSSLTEEWDILCRESDQIEADVHQVNQPLDVATTPQ